MKKFSQIIESQNSTKPYGYTANVVIKGTVYAESEGDAGYQIDSILESIEGVETTDLVDIFEMNDGQSNESLLESVTETKPGATFSIGAAAYSKPSTAQFDIWNMFLNESVVQVQVPTYLKLDRDRPYVLRVPAGETIASLLSDDRLQAK